MQTHTFDQILELVDAMSEDDQTTLFQIIQQRRIERQRDEIASNIVQAQEEYQQDTVFRGTADKIMAKLSTQIRDDSQTPYSHHQP